MPYVTLRGNPPSKKLAVASWLRQSGVAGASMYRPCERGQAVQAVAWTFGLQTDENAPEQES